MASTKPLKAFVVSAVLGGIVGFSGTAAPTGSRSTESAAGLSLAVADSVKVLLYYDMEGLAGQSDIRTFVFAYPEPYAEGRELLLADVNAVIEGLFTGGADEVHVVDAHGSGNPEPDIPVERLDPRAEMINRNASFDAYVDLVQEGAYDAVVAVGMHAKQGSGGFASHTFTPGVSVLMNRRSLTETEVVGYAWGRVGVPIIFVSGDDRLAQDLKPTMPWIEYVTVKDAAGPTDAELRPVDEVRIELWEAAKRAVENLDEARAMRLEKPVLAGLRAVPPANLALLKDVPGIHYEDETVRFVASDFRSAYDGIQALIRVAMTGHMEVLAETVSNGEDEVFSAFRENLMERWASVEAGTWTPLAEPPAPDSVSYFGFR